MKTNVNDGICSDECRKAVEHFKDTQGCCVRHYSNYLIETEAIPYELVHVQTLKALSTCGVKIPSICNSFSPPDNFLHCGHDGVINKTPKVFCITLFFMVSLFTAI